jgi:hypothetical protein
VPQRSDTRSEGILSPPTMVEFEGPDDFRDEEKMNLVRW